MHIFFDLDNTLWDFDRNSETTLEAIYRRHGLEQKFGVSFSTFFDTYAKINDDLWHLYYFGKIGKQDLRYRRFSESFARFGYSGPELSRQVADEYVKEAPYLKALKPGCIDMLEALGRSYELHIITNGFSEVQNIKLDNCGLRNYFSNVIISEDHGLTKPQVEIFRLAEKLAGTSHERCTMVGDNLVSDIEGAIGAGWRAVYYNYKNTDFSGAAISIGHLAELPSVL